MERKLVAACEKYLLIAPGAKDEIVIRYKAAFLYYQRQHFVEAAKRFGEIILRWPTDPWSQKAADLSLDILNGKEQWLALAELAEKFHADRRLAPEGSEFEKRVARLAEGARFKRAMEVYEKEKDYAVAAKLFQDFVAQHPRSEYAPAALNNSVVIAEKADQLDLVIAAAEELLREHPQADEALQKPALLSLASACERSARFPEAIRWYEQYASRWPTDPRAPDQLFNAALWREGLGDEAGALAGWQRYVKTYGSRPDAAKIAFNICLLLERQKEWGKAAGCWAGFQREHARAAAPGQLLLARYKEALARRELRKDDPAAAAALVEVAQRFEKLPESERLPAVADAAAHARFLGIEPAFQGFLAIQFNSTRQKDLVSVLKVKNERLARLLDAYTEVIRCGSAKWSEAALTRLGEAYRNFNKGLLEAPMPRGLDAEQQDLYRTTLENQALPLEDKAVDAFEKAIATGSRTGFYSEWTIRAQDSLREYKPDEFGELHQPALLGSEAAGAVRPEGIELHAAAGGGN